MEKKYLRFKQKEKFIKFREAHPTWSLSACCRVYHISRQYGWKILNDSKKGEK